MSKPRPKTNAQTGRMFGLAKPLAAQAGMETEEYLRLVVASKTSQTSGSISQLTFDEANTVIKSLGGDPFTAKGLSIRMQNYRKQAAGIKTIETDAHLTKIRELAAGRNMTDEGIAKLATRMRLPWPPSTTEQGNKLVEALKAMNARDRGPRQSSSERGEGRKVVKGDFGSKQSAAQASAEPSFRRVA